MRIKDTRYDLIIIGGGIYGAWLFYLASVAGIKTLLIEKNDFGSGTSSNSSKLIHGGLRYLKEGQFNIVRHSIREKLWYLKQAPFRVKKMPFHIPIYDHSVFKTWEIYLGLKMYGCFEKSPFGRTVSAVSMNDSERDLFKTEGLKRIYAYEDAVTDDFRMVLDLIKGGIMRGGEALNYATAFHFKQKGDIFELIAGDSIDKDQKIIESKCVFHSGGYFYPEWQTRNPVSQPLHLTFSQGIHIVLDSLNTHRAYVLSTKQDHRIFFLIPWYGKTLLGTTDTQLTHTLEGKVTPSEIQYLLEGLQTCTLRQWNTDDVIATYVGVRTFCRRDGKSTYHLNRSFELKELLKGYFVSIGGKLTTSRHDALQTLRRICTHLKCKERWPQSEDVSYPFSEPTSLDMDPVAKYLYSRYGSEAVTIHSMIAKYPGSGEPILKDEPFLKIEIVHAVKNEGALFEEDVFRRRIPLFLLSKQKDALKHTLKETLQRYHLSLSLP